MITSASIEHIKARIDILDVLGEFIRLKRRGTNYLGLCPFHGEKSPSFTVSPSKEIYKCFGCGKTGNTITFLMEHEKLSYPEALQWLARRYNIDIEETYATDEQKEAKQQSESLLVLNEWATGYFRSQLTGEEGRAVALSYLLQRGMNEEIIEKFQIGYCPSGNGMVKAALEAQFTEAVLLKSGLAAQRNGVLTDNYRERIIFPIQNISGRVIGFGARVIGQPLKAPKYINTPENELYVKSRVLYGLHQARTVIDAQDECLLVEGYTDVTSMHQAGIANVVASGGTSLTADQLRLINKYSQNLTIVYDGDAAGIKAAMRGLDMALEEGLNVRVVLVPEGEDPDSYARKHGGAGFREMILERKKDFILFQLDVLLSEAGTDVVKRNEAANVVAETLSRIIHPRDRLKLESYTRQCATQLGISEGGLVAMINAHKKDHLDKMSKKGEKLAVNESEGSARLGLEEQNTLINNESAYLNRETILVNRDIVRVLIEYGQQSIPSEPERKIADYIFHALEDYPLPQTDDSNLVFEIYRDFFYRQEPISFDTFLYHPNETVRKFVADIFSVKYEESERWKEVNAKIGEHKEEREWQDVLHTIAYLKLSMIKPWIEQNQHEFLKNMGWEYDQTVIKIHYELKNVMSEESAVFRNTINPFSSVRPPG